MSKRIWVVSELYYPEETSTGHFLTKIAEGLAQDTVVSVLCSQPTYSERGIVAPWSETRNGVNIRRCWGTRFDRKRGLGRVANLISISLSLFVQSSLRFQRNDSVLVVTNPPLLPFVVLLACRLRRATCLLLVHDVYPEVLAAVGLIRKAGVRYRFIKGLSSWLFRTVSKVIVLGRDMARIAADKGRPDAFIIPNWGDLEFIVPMPRNDVKVLSALGLQHKFIIQYCGNMGRTHGLDSLVVAAKRLAGEVWFLMIGSGARLEWAKEQAATACNMTVLERCSREHLCDHLNACDIAVISFISGMRGVSVPSRMYNVMAAGKPILAVADEDSELAMVVREERIGWVVKPGDIDGIVDVIRKAKNSPDELAEMGRRARLVVETRYSLALVIDKYRMLFSSDSVCSQVTQDD
jgi:glycosyltransferase involved in cell wall biosynthesis